MSNNLMRIDYGEKEYQKLVLFTNFIKDFGAFAGREAKEVVIWDICPSIWFNQKDNANRI